MLKVLNCVAHSFTVKIVRKHAFQSMTMCYATEFLNQNRCTPSSFFGDIPLDECLMISVFITDIESCASTAKEHDSLYIYRFYTKYLWWLVEQSVRFSGGFRAYFLELQADK